MSAAEEVLHWGFSKYGQRFAVVTSFQKEGMVLVDMAARMGGAVRVVTLDTGRLPVETYTMVDAVRERYGISVELVKPDPEEVARMVAMHGPDLFRDQVVLRKLCCQVRKVRPMDRVLAGVDAYAVGLRRGQAESRESVAQSAQVDGKWKLSPLAFWSAADVDEYTRRHSVPVHPLYARGYISIGCAPCTRAAKSEEGERAGRWWWEEEGDKECGLHFTPQGKMVRQLDVLLEDLMHA
ncbi:MAG: phosphoadenylyl-sulfate reductase [Bryobacteraceae bacterium]